MVTCANIIPHVSHVTATGIPNIPEGKSWFTLATTRAVTLLAFVQNVIIDDLCERFMRDGHMSRVLMTERFNYLQEHIGHCYQRVFQEDKHKLSRRTISIGRKTSMETALDVLSRAASMVETNDKQAQDPLYKGLALPPPPQPPLERAPLPPSTPEHRELIDNRSSPGKELPSKMNMHERVKNWLDVSKPPKYDTEHRTIRQATAESRLTIRSSPTPDHYRNGESVSEAYSLHHHNFLSGHPSLRTPPPHPPPRYPHPLPVEPQSPNEGPLNLTINNSNNNSSSNHSNHSPSQSRPSVITCTTLADRRYETNSNGSASPSRKEPITDLCDPAIEEHFRRSLGKNYPEYLRHHSATPSPPPPPMSQSMASPHTLPVAPPRMASPDLSVPVPSVVTGKNVSITGSVDDHFARALGDSTWSALKAKNDPSEAPAPNSVDDHFAKALGDTWLRLKDKKEQPKGSHPFPLSHPIPHPLPHPIPRAHSLPHPLPQRPSSPSSQSHSGSLLST